MTAFIGVLGLFGMPYVKSSVGNFNSISSLPFACATVFGRPYVRLSATRMLGVFWFESRMRFLIFSFDFGTAEYCQSCMT